MSVRSIPFRSFRSAGTLVAATAVVALASSSPVFATDAVPASGGAAGSAASAAPADAAAIKAVRCDQQKLHVEWNGAGVNAVDYYSAGDPFLQARQDPAPTQTSMDIPLDSKWHGRKLDVRLFDKRAKLLDSKSVDCSKPS